MFQSAARTAHRLNQKEPSGVNTGYVESRSVKIDAVGPIERIPARVTCEG